MNDLSHCVTVACKASFDDVFEFMADGIALGGWALGTFNTVRVDENTVRGKSLYTGQERYVRPIADRERGTIVYEVGEDHADPKSMVPWIWAIVQPSERLGGDKDTCLLSIV